MAIRLKLSKKEKEQLGRILECEPADVKLRLKKYEAAATEEYVRMILGQRVFTRGQDVREYRLYLLIEHVFDKRLPTEQQISALFQTTTTQSRALLRAVMSKYQYELEGPITSTLKDVLSTANQDGQTKRWTITIDSDNVVSALNRRLAGIDGTLPPVVRAKDGTTAYEIANSAYVMLKES